MRTALEFAECALLPKWDKYTYAQMDCQAFVEAVLKDIGVRKPNGSVYKSLVLFLLVLSFIFGRKPESRK